MGKIRLKILLLSILISSSSNLFSLHTIREAPIFELDYTVVIGAFSIYKNATRFVDYASEQRCNAKYEFNPDKNLYYVFTLKTNDRVEAIGEAKRLREETSFTDAWVYQQSLGSSISSQHEDNPDTQQKLEQVLINQTEETKSIAEQSTINKKISDVDSKKFVFQLYRANDKETVSGDVDMIDAEKAKKLASYESNKPILISAPDNSSGNITLVANVFGYRKNQKDINFNKPEGEVISTDDQSAFVIPFELVRLHKGDIVVMYNVFFYKDAAVMMPESQYEVNSLLQMMKENPKCKINLHGHTNGNASGKIISLNDSKNFFSLSGTKNGYGSAKQLSEERAGIIKEYLIDNGIESTRINVTAWGGKRPLYDKEGARAKENVRVEVEILEE